jgi:hypothetical protein
VNGAAGDDVSVAGGDDGEEVESYDGLKEGLSKVCLMVSRRGDSGTTVQPEGLIEKYLSYLDQRRAGEHYVCV